jgi:hypothetical protein
MGQRWVLAAAVAFAVSCLPALGEDNSVDDSDSHCVSYIELLHDMYYGRCAPFQMVEGQWGTRNLCPKATRTLNTKPENVVTNLLSETAYPKLFANALNCRFMPTFFRDTVNRTGSTGRTLLHQYADACDRDHVVMLRALGAREVRDRWGSTPLRRLNMAMERADLSLRTESDATKAASLQQNVQACKDTLDVLQKPRLTVEDFKPLGIPGDFKVILIEYGKTHGTVVDVPSPRSPASTTSPTDATAGTPPAK